MADSVGKQLDDMFASFERRSGWRLSLPAKVIIQQAFISVEMDDLGMGDHAGKSDRGPTTRDALSKLPGFFEILKEQAAKRPDVEKKSEVIGGIFVLQHIRAWKSLIECPCWPE